MIFGGSPHMVELPPRFAQKISARINGTGSKRRSRASSIVTAARNRMTVMLSMNMDSPADSSMKVKNMAMGL